MKRSSTQTPFARCRTGFCLIVCLLLAACGAGSGPDASGPVIHDPKEPPTEPNGAPQRIHFSGSQTAYDATQWPVCFQGPAHQHCPPALSAPFGPRIKASDNDRYDFHRGIDIPAPIGTPVKAMADGVIFRVYRADDAGSPYPDGGNVVILRHEFDQPFMFHGHKRQYYYSHYLHLNTITVQPPDGAPYQSIQAGTQIGTVGDSGTTDFVHLHFETRVGSYCSREYQRAHRGTECSGAFRNGPVDPHVNPLLFLPYDNAGSLQVTVARMDPLTIEVTSNRRELDFNALRVVSGGTEKYIDFNTRAGINPRNIDDNHYNGVIIKPAPFIYGDNAPYSIKFVFPALTGYDTIVATDIRGNGVRLVH